MRNKPTVQLRQTQLERDNDNVAAFIQSGKSPSPDVIESTKQDVAKPTNPEVNKTTIQDIAKSTSQHADNTLDFRRVTYYLRPEQATEMKLLAVRQGRNLSELAREAIDNYLSSMGLTEGP